MQLKIAHKFIGTTKPVFIIAEAGVNHNADINFTLKLIDAAAAAGADVIKFQTFRSSNVVTVKGKLAAYQQKNTGLNISQKEMLEKLELPENYYLPILKRAREKKILFMSTPHGGFQSVNFLEKLDVIAYKIGSGDLTNIPLLEYVAKTHKPIILSTGMSVVEEIREAIEAIQKHNNNNIALLHCTSCYPCPQNRVNLHAMEKMIQDFPFPIGYSDHTIGIEVAVDAVLLGACIIEKHITLNKKLPGPDQKNSLEPDEFTHMVMEIRAIEKMDRMQKKILEGKIKKSILGSKEKKPITMEKIISSQVRKSLVWSHSLSKGHTISTIDINIKRPADGLHPREYWNIMGKKIAKNVLEDQAINIKDIK